MRELRGVKQVNGSFDTEWMAAQMQRSLDLTRVERLGRLGWRPWSVQSWLVGARRRFGRWVGAESARPALCLPEREEVVSGL